MCRCNLRPNRQRVFRQTLVLAQGWSNLEDTQNISVCKAQRAGESPQSQRQQIGWQDLMFHNHWTLTTPEKLGCTAWYVCGGKLSACLLTSLLNCLPRLLLWLLLSKKSTFSIGKWQSIFNSLTHTFLANKLLLKGPGPKHWPLNTRFCSLNNIVHY